jgi:hypothetical protein
MSRSLSGSLIILESARKGKIYRGRVVVARREKTERDRKEHEEDDECRKPLQTEITVKRLMAFSLL